MERRDEPYISYKGGSSRINVARLKSRSKWRIKGVSLERGNLCKV